MEVRFGGRIACVGEEELPGHPVDQGGIEVFFLECAPQLSQSSISLPNRWATS